MVDVEHALIALRQKRPLSESHTFVPQTQVSELVERPLVLEQAEMTENEHWLYVLLQNIPFTELHTLVPQEHPTVLINAPLLLEQALPPEHVLLEESQ